MKVFVYNWRDFDEKAYFERFCSEFGFELGYTVEKPTMDNIELARGSDFISIITTPITAEMLDRLKEMGVRLISTRTIGYNHIDVAHAKEIGMTVTNVTYDPEGVADYTVMMILMAVRKVDAISARGARNDFTLDGLMGRCLHDLRIGIIGAGKIGCSVLRDLSGFGCELFYANRSENKEASKYAERLETDDLLKTCDVVSLHLELCPETEHVIGDRELALMKQGAILVNTARGPLVDTDALVRSVKSGHLGGAALDVIEGEFDMCYYDRSGDGYRNRYLEAVRSQPGIIHTHHMAFYYETAVRDMVYNSLYSMKKFSEGGDVPHRLA